MFSRNKTERGLNKGFDDLLFEERNKDYGAYELRHLYLRHIVIACSATFICFMVVVFFPEIRRWIEKEQPRTTGTVREVQAWNLTMLPQEVIQYTQQAPISTPRTRMLPRLREILVTDELIRDTLKSRDDLDALIQKGQEEDNTSEPNMLIDTSTYGLKDQEHKATVLVPVQVLPRFNGSDYQITFRQWVTNTLKYPLTASDNKISGKLVIQFSVSCDGYVHDVVLVQGIHPLLDAETVRTVSSSPQWEPAMRNGKKTGVRLTMPVSFTIPN